MSVYSIPNNGRRSIPRIQGSTQSRQKIRRNSKRISLGWVISHILLFAFLAGVTQALFGLLGQTSMEKSRREGIRAIEKTRALKMEVHVLRQNIEKLSNIGAVERWAVVRGYIPSEANVKKPGPDPAMVAKL